MGRHYDPNKGKFVSTRNIPRMFGPEGKNVTWVDADQSKADTRIAKRNAERLRAKQAAAAQKVYDKQKKKAEEKARKKAEKKNRGSKP